MKKPEYRISELMRVGVYDAAKPNRRIGRVHAVVFHPHRRMVVGFTVRRPDVALMVHRSDLFVAIDRFDEEDGHLLVSDDKASTGNAACRRLGVVWDDCILWQGMSLLTEDGRRLGLVGDVHFRSEDGQVLSLTVDRGATAGALLGIVEIPASYVRGFKTGVGDKLSADEGDDFMCGGIIVSEEAFSTAAEGGLAERAGRASAVASSKVSSAVDKARPVASRAARRTEEAINDGAFALGRQLGRTKGMFSSFKEEYRKARYEERDQ